MPRWITYFSILVVFAGAYAWLTVHPPLWPLLVIVKNWLFPFSLFFLGRRTRPRTGTALVPRVCVAAVSLGLALHGLRDGLTTGHLLTNRPTGLLTGQANLFAGFLGMQALLCLFVARTRELAWMERGFLVGAAFVMVVTLVFTLSRGAWLAFGLAGMMVGFVTNRVAVVLLVIAVLIGSRWAPEEATARADMTIAAVDQSGDSSLEEALDDSAALRVIQWKTLPDLLAESPLFGTGISTFAQRLSEHTGIYRSAHATMVQIGTEMGVLGLVGYLGLFASVALACVSRARRATSGTFVHATGLGLLAATVCLFLADFSGTRFPAHTVTTYYWLLVGAFLGATDTAVQTGHGIESEPGTTTMSSTTGQPPERRVLYVISRYTYRSTFIVREIEELAARGWTIAVVSPSPADLQPGTHHRRSAVCGHLRSVSRRARAALGHRRAGDGAAPRSRVRASDGQGLRPRPPASGAQPRRDSQGLLLRRDGPPPGLPAHPRPLGDGVDVGGDVDLPIVRSAVLLHGACVGHLL